MDTHASPCHLAQLVWSGKVYPRCSRCKKASTSYAVVGPRGVTKVVPIRLNFAALPGRRAVRMSELIPTRRRRRAA